MNSVAYDIENCPVVHDGSTFKMLSDYFLAKANLSSYGGTYRVWFAGGTKGDAGATGGSFEIQVVSAMPENPAANVLYLVTE